MNSVRCPEPRLAAPLDPGFRPAALENRPHQRNLRTSTRVVIGLEREGGLISRYETLVGDAGVADTFESIERTVKFLLWSRGGWRMYFGGPRALGEHIRGHYSRTGARAFDVELMSRVYERPFDVVLTEPDEVPAAQEGASAVGRHWDGCRIGFDLGASDYKVAAVKDGEVLYSDEFPWDPKNQPDPVYHFTHINDGLKRAAAHLPRVDAIGGSTAGVVVDNRIMVASLFRAVPEEKRGDARDIFLRLRGDWNVPIDVANDGDVTALAGAMSLGETAVLGVAMGSSEAVGYLDVQGRITGWLNELAFAPVDNNPAAPMDEWSGDRGVGAQYFSQQAVNRLLPAAGIVLPPEMGLPERLKTVQKMLADGDERAAAIFHTIGVYLGYTIPHYAECYDCRHLLILGRVTSGEGGNIILSRAREVLEVEFPEVSSTVALHVPDETTRRVGQAVAAASLPALRREES